MAKTYMLDTCICSFIMREKPESVLERLAAEVRQQHRIVISAITYAEMRYAEMRYGEIGKKASPKHAILINEFIRRLDAILPWDSHAVDATIAIKRHLTATGAKIGDNDMAIAGHAIAAQCILVTNNVAEFNRVDGLMYQDWVH